MNKFCIIIAWLSLMNFSSVQGAITGTWTGAGTPNNVWDIPANWSSNPNFPHMIDDEAIFNGNTPTTLSLGSPITIGTLLFETAGTYTIQDAMNTLTFSASSGLAAIETGAGAGNSIIGVPVALNSTLRTIIQSPTAVTISGDISGPFGLFTDGDGTLILGGTNNFTGSTQINAGGITVTGFLPNQVTIDSGILALSGAGTLSSSSVVSFEPEAVFSISDANGDRTQQDVFGTGGQILLGANTLTVSTSSSDFYSGTILDGGAGGGFTKEGTGIITLGASTDYSGNTTVNAGTLKMGIENVIPNSDTLQVANGAVFNLADFNQSIQNLTGSGDIQLGSGTLTVNPTAAIDSFGGIISGSGSLVKEGAETLVLSGINSYTGSTTVNGGTLEANAMNVIASSSGISIGAGATFDLNGFDQTIQDLSGAGDILLGSHILTVNPVSETVLFSGVISGSGGLEKRGPNQLILSGANTYMQGTDVFEGNLTVNGSLASLVIVHPFASIAGDGTIQDLLQLDTNSVLIPGNVLTTPLTVDRALFLPGSEYLVIINSAGQSSELVATGASGITVFPGSEIFVFPETGVYKQGTAYPILHTTTGTIVNGTGFSVFSLNPKFQFTLVEDPMNTVFLVLNENATLFTIPTAGLNGNRLIVANYLNTLDTLPSLDPIFTDFFFLTPEETADALDAISPARNAFATYASEWTAFIFNQVLDSRLSNRRLTRPNFKRPHDAGLTAMAMTYKKNKKLGPECVLVPPKPLSCETFSAWVAPFGEFAHEKAQKQTPAFHLNAGGVVAGFDWFDLEHVLLGLALGYAFIDVNENNHFGKIWQNDYTASLYTSLYASQFYADISIWGGYNQIRGKRNISFPGFNAAARSRTHSWQVVPHFDFGYDILFKWGTIEPFASFDWAINMQPSFSETGAAPLDMHQKSQTSLLMRTELGVSAYQTWKFRNAALLIVRESASYVYKKPFGSNGQVTAAIVGAPGGSFTVETLTNSQDLFAPGLEAFYRTRNGVFASLTYEGEFGSGFWSNTVIAKAGKEF